LELEESSEKYQVLGWALFRVGKWQSAIETIGKHKTDGKSDFKQSAFVLAMAYWQLGDKEKGREWFALGNEWMSGYLKKCYEDRWRSSQIWSPTPRSERRLQSEAAELLGIPLTDDETLNGQNDTDNKP
jgi:hypothetical protein